MADPMITLRTDQMEEDFSEEEEGADMGLGVGIERPSEHSSA